uniref:Uncharacterized protein n=1 Tax=Ditylenchus dipsaci TaxID=166011 RepID=A0A915CWF9_9BILA
MVGGLEDVGWLISLSIQPRLDWDNGLSKERYFLFFSLDHVASLHYKEDIWQLVWTNIREVLKRMYTERFHVDLLETEGVQALLNLMKKSRYPARGKLIWLQLCASCEEKEYAPLTTMDIEITSYMEMAKGADAWKFWIDNSIRAGHLFSPSLQLLVLFEAHSHSRYNTKGGEGQHKR